MLWSDNWWIEDKKAYFCGAEIAALFCMDLDNLQCELLAVIPESEIISYRLYPFCVKDGHFIYCLPCRGKKIWYYDLLNGHWDKIELRVNLDTVMLSWPKIYDRKIWLEDCRYMKMVEVDLDKRNINWEYKLPIVGKLLYGGRNIIVNDKIYCVNEIMVCCINIKTREIKNYDMTSLNMILFTIFFDGENFWLSGNRKRIYIWNPEIGIVKIIKDFPDDFGVYQPRKDNSLEINYNPRQDSKYFLFDHTIEVGKHVWFLPFFANQIVYIDKTSYCIHTLDIHTEQYVAGRRPSNMYRQLLEYIRDNRYIGVYSSKADCIFEIDAENLNVSIKEYSLKSKSLEILANRVLAENSVLLEGNSLDESLFALMIRKDFVESKIKYVNIGQKIYKDII